MAATERFAPGGAGRDLLPLPATDPHPWDDMSAVTRRWEQLIAGEIPLSAVHLALPLPSVGAPPPEQPNVGQKAHPPLIMGEMCLLPLPYLRAIDWEAEAVGVTFGLDASLLAAAARHAPLDVTGELVWALRKGLKRPFAS
jgi:hypothetical protein